jgi:hypothetical protein
VGNSTAATLTEIEQTRDRLERDMAELAERLPAPAIWLKRLAGVAVGGGVGGTLFWFLAHRIRNRAKKGKEQKAAKEAAAAVVRAPVVQVLPPEWGQRLGELFENGQWKGPALALGSVWLLLRWMELRRLKRLTKAMLLAR